MAHASIMLECTSVGGACARTTEPTTGTNVATSVNKQYSSSRVKAAVAVKAAEAAKAASSKTLTTKMFDSSRGEKEARRDDRKANIQCMRRFTL